MNLSKPFIHQPVMTVLLVASATLFGVLAYRGLPVNDLPSVDYPVIQVQALYPGGTPETMANNVATPLEQQFLQIPGLDQVTSTSSQGVTTLVLQFELSKSVDAAATDVQSAISRASGQLPLDLPSPPTFLKVNPNDQPILFIGMMSDTETAGKLYDYAKLLAAQRIAVVPGVSQVAVFGTQAAVRVKADPSALASRGLTMADLAAAIQNGTSYQGSGQFDSEHKTVLLEPKGQLETADDYNGLIVNPLASPPVYLRDVAKAVESVQNERLHMRFWIRGQKVPSAAVVLAVYRQGGSNAVVVARAAKALLPSIQAELPASVTIIPIHDRSETIVSSVSDVQVTLVIAFVLVVGVIFMFLGRARDTLVPAAAMPLSLLIVFIVMKALGYSLDNLSLMGLTLVIGFLVDDAVVFLENTVRRMEQFGEGVLEATLKSAEEISFTILSMTLSLAAVFIPLVFMTGLIGRIFREFSITIVAAVLASGVVSLTLTPMMCSRVLGRRGKDVKKNWVERVIGAVERRVLGAYGRSLWWFLKHKWVSALVWAGCMYGTFWLFKQVPQTFLPTGDSSFIRGVMIGQEGTSPEEMVTLAEGVEEFMHEANGVRMTFTMVGSPNFTANQALVLAFLKDPSERQPIQAIASQFMGETFQRVPGAITLLQPDPVLRISTGATATQQGKYAYSISGSNPAEVYATAGRLMERFRRFKGFLTVSSDLFDKTPRLQIDVLRGRAKTYGVSSTRILTLLKDAYSQNYIYLIKKSGDQYQLILEARDSDRMVEGDLARLYISSDDGNRTVPFSAVAKWKTTLGLQAVNHINQFPSVTFFFNVDPAVSLGEATNYIRKSADEILPPTIQGSLQGEAETFRSTVGSLVVLMVLAVFVMYVILGILYESYLHPLTVLSSLPVALVGGLATLWLFGEQASLYAFIGMFMLMGIVKKNGILIVDFALQRIAAGRTAAEAIHDGSMDRFRPIMMTTLAAMMGAVPIAVGYGADGASRRPLGLVVVGGLIVSQFITLYITPAIYLYMEMFQEKVLDRVPFLRNVRTAGAGKGKGETK